MIPAIRRSRSPKTGHRHQVFIQVAGIRNRSGTGETNQAGRKQHEPDLLCPSTAFVGTWANAHAWASWSAGVVLPVDDSQFAVSSKHPPRFFQHRQPPIGVEDVEQHDVINRAIRQS